MEIYNKLLAIQRDLKAPKSQWNSFGGYKYRNCEDILEAAKPLLAEQGCALTISDDVVTVGGRVYVKATATLYSGSESVINTALAREAEEKKGMDASQVTGAASSYARKYALNGLFCIDDTKDADFAPQAKNCSCEVCGKVVEEAFAAKSKAANNGHIYCSRKCKETANG